jgi:7-carboxy-7-deazaguanine synthase
VALNQQPTEKLERQASGATLDVHSIFYTIQGEGPLTGRAAVFVRLAGCNLQCPLCDTEYTQGRRRITIEEIVDEVGRLYVAQSGAFMPLVVITGGEPFRQPNGLRTLCYALDMFGYDIQIETNGSLPISDFIHGLGVDIVCSPKANVSESNWRMLEDVKYVLSADDQDPEDGLPIKALGHPVYKRVARPPAGWRGTIWLNPADHHDPDINRRNIDAVKAACMRHGYRMGVQLHKYIDVP